MKHCPECGSVMLHFENPDRVICPETELHAALQAMKARKGTKKEEGT